MVKVIGENETSQRARAYLAEGDVYVVEHSPLFTFKILESRDLACAVVDGVDSPLEARFVSLLTELSPAGRVVLARKGGNQDDRALVITVPARPDERHAAALAILRVCLQLAGRKRRWLPAWLGLVLVLAAKSAIAGEGGYMSPRAKAGIKTAFARAVATSGQIQGGTVDQGLPGLSPWLVTFSGVSHIICDSGCGSPPATADSTAFTAGTTNVTPIAGVFDDTLANMTAGTYGAQRFTKQRAAHINLRDANGNEILTTSPSHTLAISIVDPISPTDIVRVSGGGHAVWLQDQFGNTITVGQTDPASNTRAISVRDPQTVNVAASVASVDTKLTDGTQKTKLTDGTNTATVRAGSAAAQVGDTSVVVALNPNTPVIQTNTQQNIQSITANGQSIDAAGLSQQYGTAVYEISNAWVGTLTFRGRDASGDSYKDISAVNLATGAVGTTTTANGLYAIPVAGLYAVQVIATAWTSGQADISNGLTGIPSAVSVSTPVAVGSSALPAGAATSTNQSTEIASLASIDAKLPTQINGGQPVYIINPAKLPAPFRCNALRKTNCS